ncbi:MAG: type I secretion system permease/ATPase, partial [Candidatus Methylumidiphilus sp.]
ELGKALQSCRSSFLFAGFFSLFVNLLLLVPSFYMLAVYDRVLSSSSESTLLMLTLITVFLFLVMGGLEWIRSQILITTSTRLDQMLGGRVFDSVFALALASGGKTSTAQPLGDLLQLRQFLTGNGLFAFFDAPWLPIYVLLLFLFHFWFGMAAVISVVVLVGLAIWNELSTQADLKEANVQSNEASQMTQSHLRNAEAIEAMGMLPRMRGRWQHKQLAVLALQARASAKGGLINALVKTFRMTIQSLVLGLGAYLAIHKEITPGLVISGSILLGRALAPLDLMIASWRGFQGARQAYGRLNKLLAEVPAREPPMALPTPKGEIRLDNVVVTPKGAKHPILKGISMLLEPGMQVAVLGPSAAGKSTLVRAILGIYLPEKGSVRLDGAEIHHWDRAQLGEHVGYMPQDVELLDGTIGENIARFGVVDPDKVVAAAQAAGIHEMILHLPDGYDTRLAGNGHALSTGQRQRVGIARAVYGNPRVVILDEPNSNLDQAGEAALLATLASLRRNGASVIVVAHRTNILAQVDKILLLLDGQAAFYGPRDEGLALLTQATAKPAAPPAAPPAPKPAPGGMFKY